MLTAVSPALGYGEARGLLQRRDRDGELPHPRGYFRRQGRHVMGGGLGVLFLFLFCLFLEADAAHRPEKPAWKGSRPGRTCSDPRHAFCPGVARGRGIKKMRALPRHHLRRRPSLRGG